MVVSFQLQSQHLTDRKFLGVKVDVKVGSGMNAVKGDFQDFILLLVVLSSASYRNGVFSAFFVAIAIRARQVGIAKGQILAKGSPKRR